ncbi:restriction endonuclease subunit S [Klebsiella pneumoniae]
MVPKGWVLGCVGDLLIGLESGVSVNGEDRHAQPGEKSVLKVSAVSYGCFDPKASKVIDKSEISRAKTKPRAGQIIVSRSNTESLVGASAYIDKDYQDLFLPDKLWQTVPKSDASMKWLSYVLASEHVRYTLSKLATGTSGSMKNITKGELLTLKILIPSLPEQNKIAQILSTWDTAISTTQQLLANSNKQKKTLMQQLLTGKKCFPEFSEDWKEVYLGDIAKITTGSSNRQDSQLSGKYTFFDRSEDIRSSDRYLFDGEAVIVPGEGQDFVPKYFFGKFDLHQRTYAIMDFPTCDGKYLFYAIHYFRAHFLSQAVGSTVKSLRLPMFQKMRLYLPTLAQQKKIASILSNADREIELLQQKLSYLKKEKKALMQQLLTGKRRVKMEVA